MERVNVKSKRQSSLSTVFVAAGCRYMVETELTGKTKSRISSRVFKEGEVVYSTSEELSEWDIVNAEVFGDMAEHYHKRTMEIFKKKLKEKEKEPYDYINAANVLLNRRNLRGALQIAADGLKIHPEDPFLLSVHGYLLARVDKECKEGLEECKRAIKLIGGIVPSDLEYLYPEFFLNLGRVYMEAGDKKNAIDVYNRVLAYHNAHPRIRTEMRKLGLRRKPVFPFLKRSNPLNKITGKLLFSISGKKAAFAN